jgi:hypothetical protein
MRVSSGIFLVRGVKLCSNHAQDSICFWANAMPDIETFSCLLNQHAKSIMCVSGPI